MQYTSGDKIKDVEMGGSCSTHSWGNEKSIRVLARTPYGKGHLEYRSIDARIILN
jgi:hypothetical protein